jgi:hypothetical protein
LIFQCNGGRKSEPSNLRSRPEHAPHHSGLATTLLLFKVRHEVHLQAKSTAKNANREKSSKLRPNRITWQACHKAFKKAIARQPALEVAEIRKLDTMCCEEMFMHLQQGIRKGNARAVEVAVKALDHKAKINGYRSYGSEPEIAVQAGIEPPKSRAELEAEGAQYIDLFRSAVQILVDLGVPLPQLDRPPVETTASPMQAPAGRGNPDDTGT